MCWHYNKQSCQQFNHLSWILNPKPASDIIRLEETMSFNNSVWPVELASIIYQLQFSTLCLNVFFLFYISFKHINCPYLIYHKCNYNAIFILQLINLHSLHFINHSTYLNKPVNLLYLIKYTLQLKTSTLCFNVSLNITITPISCNGVVIFFTLEPNIASISPDFLKSCFAFITCSQTSFWFN